MVGGLEGAGVGLRVYIAGRKRLFGSVHVEAALYRSHVGLEL